MIKIFPKERISQAENVIFAKWKTDSVSTKQFVGMRENAFVFVLKGKKNIFKDGKPVTIGKNELLILKKGVHEMTEYLAEDNLFEALVIYFDSKFIAHLKSIDIPENNDENAQMMVLPREETIDSFVMQYMSYLDENDVVLQQLKVAELVYLLIKKYPGTKAFFASLIRSNTDLKMLMEKLYKENYTVAQLAGFSNRSLSSFKRDFIKEFGITPARWISVRKLSEARQELINTNKNVSDIAYECGFESLSQFDKSFKKEFNVTPTVFREKNK
ncbi:MAG: AraC family transcriptional regulator [Dysgonamonadaceae bacterium]